MKYKKQLNIRIETENSAFDDPNEIPNILRKIAQRIGNGEKQEGTVWDTNGNRVGEWSIS